MSNTLTDSNIPYPRPPRRLIICTGPPSSDNNDPIMAQKIDHWEGTKVISGGTTAQIIARELHREISVNLRRDISGLPPTATMEGIDLITEGVLTLAGVVEILMGANSDAVPLGTGTDYNIVRLLLSHDVIHFVVGTRVNVCHQDPSLPIELQRRHDLVTRIAHLLGTKFHKELLVEYL